ncbi:MAG: alpha/beta hydrolase [Mycobacteriales bacterium]
MQVDVGALRFSVHTAGADDGRPVLLLHGFPQSSLCWSRLAPLLNAAGLLTVAPDQRGYSPGARPAAVAAYALPELVADAIGVLDALDLSTVDVVGHDWGAVVAWQLAVRHPHRVRSLTAVSVPHPVALSAAMAGDADQRQRSAYISLLRREGEAEQVLLADGALRLRELLTGSGLSEPDVDRYVTPLLEPAALTAALSWYRAITRTDAALGPVEVPTTFVWSDGDTAIGRAAAQACAAEVSGPYHFVELTGVSHWVPEQAPVPLAEAVLAQVAAT